MQVKLIIEFNQTEYELTAVHSLNKPCWKALRLLLNSLPGVVCWTLERPVSKWSEFKWKVETEVNPSNPNPPDESEDWNAIVEIQPNNPIEMRDSGSSQQTIERLQCLTLVVDFTMAFFSFKGLEMNQYTTGVG